MTAIKRIFRYQLWHLLSLAVLVFTVQFYISNNPNVLSGMFWGLNTKSWLWLSIAIPVIHQTYVLLVWRIELHTETFSTLFGTGKAFKLYAAGFSLLFVSRLIVIVFLSASNKGSLQVDPVVAYLIAALIAPFVLYLFYSVKKYFTIERAYGIDHFDQEYSEPYEKRGIFKYTDNGMYVFGLMILYLPGLLMLSEAALLAALFNHVYIWVHYYFTERPDMIEIYGKAP
jgi:hypothetical protein